MASERQRRLYEAIEQKPFPLIGGRSYKKEAELVGGKFDHRWNAYDDEEDQGESGRMEYLDTRQEQQQNARRRRIYENQYNRPYPNRKNVQLQPRPSVPVPTYITPTESFGSEERTSNNGSVASSSKRNDIVVDETDLPPLTLPKLSPQSGRTTVKSVASTLRRKNGKAAPPEDLPPSELLTTAFRKLTECASTATTECAPIIHDFQNCAEAEVELSMEQDRTMESEYVEDDQTAESKSVSLIGLDALSQSPSRNTSYTSLEDLVRYENEDELMESCPAPRTVVTPDRDTRIVGEQWASPTDVTAVNTMPMATSKKQVTIQPNNSQDPIAIVEESTGRSVSSSPVSRTEQKTVRKGRQNNTSNDTKSKKRSSSDTRRFQMMRTTHESHDTLHNFLRESGDHTLKLYIDDYQESTFDRIVESFYGNTKLKTLAICRGGFHVDRSAETTITGSSRNPRMGTHRTPEEMRCLFEAMRCLPNLHTLLLWNIGEDILPSLAENIPRRIRKLNLHLAPVEGAAIPDDLLDILASKKHLKNVQFETFGSMDIGRLLYCKSLETIELVGDSYEFDPAHIMNLADAISETRHETKLLTLDMAPEIDPSSWGYLSEALQTNRSVQFLRVTCHGDGENPKTTDGIALDMAQLIRTNRTLTHAINFANKSLVVSSTASGAVIEAIQTNDNLLEFNFFKEDPMFWASKEAILKRNSGFGEGCGLNGLGDNPMRSFYDTCVDFSISLREWGKLCI